MPTSPRLQIAGLHRLWRQSSVLCDRCECIFLQFNQSHSPVPVGPMHSADSAACWIRSARTSRTSPTHGVEKTPATSRCQSCNIRGFESMYRQINLSHEVSSERLLVNPLVWISLTVAASVGALKLETLPTLVSCSTSLTLAVEEPELKFDGRPSCARRYGIQTHLCLEERFQYSCFPSDVHTTLATQSCAAHGHRLIAVERHPVLYLVDVASRR